MYHLSLHLRNPVKVVWTKSTVFALCNYVAFERVWAAMGVVVPSYLPPFLIPTGGWQLLTTKLQPQAQVGLLTQHRPPATKPRKMKRGKLGRKLGGGAFGGREGGHWGVCTCTTAAIST